MTVTMPDDCWNKFPLPFRDGDGLEVLEVEPGVSWTNFTTEEEQKRLKIQGFEGRLHEWAVLDDRRTILLVTTCDNLPSSWGILAQKLGAVNLKLDPSDEGFMARAAGFLAARRTFGTETAALSCEGKLSPTQRAILQAYGSALKLIEAPTSQLHVAELVHAGVMLAEQYDARCQVFSIDDDPDAFPAIHAVGRTALGRPQLLRFTWGNIDHPRVSLVGKGVVFDTGGLNLKPGQSMGLMRKDMGGAAFVLGLASAIMAKGLPVYLDVLIPAVENGIGIGAMRPGDILSTRAGISVEIGNTDAEGRLILADAMDLAVEAQPDLLIDVATLTGAARVAMGFDITPYFSRDPKTRVDLLSISQKIGDPLWPLPLWEPYERKLRSGFADINNVGDDGFGGAIIAACFLSKFCEDVEDWLHLDLAAWDHGDRPGHRKGAAMAGWFSILAYLEERYGSS